MLKKTSKTESLKLYSATLIVFVLLNFSNKTVAVEKNSQIDLQKLPEASGVFVDGLRTDWLVKRSTEKASVFKDEKGNELVLSNGIISRSFRLAPNAATVSLKVLSKEFILA